MSPGFLFMFGIYGKRPTRETVRLLKSTNACGVLLLARNIDTPAQTLALTSELVQRVGRPLLFSIDHECGWVLRFKNGVTAFPGNAALGRARDPKLAYAVGRQMALELSAMGIHINLAPVLDVAERYNPGIGIRSFGGDPRLVAKLGSAMIRGLQDFGVSACAKHFPGKGAARVDAHVQLPTISLPRPVFERVHLSPFKAAALADVDCVMTSHVRFPGLDSVPATFSAKITRDILRRRLGFDGVVICDDLCMGAIAGRWPIQIAAVKALEAGHDILLIAHDLSVQKEAAQLLEQGLEDGAFDKTEVERSTLRIQKLFDRKIRRPQTASPADGEALGDKIAKLALEVVQTNGPKLPFRPQKKPLLVLAPDFSQVSELFTFEGGPRGPEDMFKEVASSWGRVHLKRAPVQSTDLGGLKELIEKSEQIVFFCFEARRFPGQNATLELLKKTAPGRTVVCLIRSPWDREKLSKDMTALDAKSYRLFSLRAAWKFILGVKS